MKEQKLIKVGPKERTALSLTTSTNRRVAENWDRELRRKKGPAACLWCGAESCGVLWTRPGDPEPGGERCCLRCSHEPVEGWQHTHTAWSGGQSFPVCALTMHEGEVVYLRRDGVVQFLELRAPKTGAALQDDSELDVPAVVFQGLPQAGAGLYVAGEGGERHTSLWANQRQLDPVWLIVRMQSAVARDQARKLRREGERKERELAHDRRVEEIIAQEAAAREASIAKRQIAHETRIVMDEMDADAALSGEQPGDELDLDQELDLDGDADSEPVEAAPAAAPEPERPVNLKAPVPVKKGPGRPKRSARQRRARERQKRAWARQEAKNRLEVKRLERAARAAGRNLVEEPK